jgi:arylsulfatase A-like enzyme
VLIRLGLVLAPFLVVAGISTAEPQQPDIVIITVDSLRADRVGSTGGRPSLTPVIDGLAARGIAFRNATVTTPRTTPGLASLMTGLWPYHHGAREVHSPITHGVMLAEVLHSHGYVTIGYSANTSAGDAQGFAKGFDRFKAADSRAHTVTKFLLSAVATSEPGRPHFVWAHYLEPHWPYGDDVSDRTSACSKLGVRIASGELSWGELQSNAGGFAEGALADCTIMYDRDVATVDRAIGELLEGLDDPDRKNGEIVVFTADHGESFGEDGLFYEHGPSLNDASVRIPLVVAVPNFEAGRIIDSPIQIEDLMPTILSLARIPSSEFPEMDGTDRTAWLATNGTEGREALTFHESAGALASRQSNFLRSGWPGGRSCINGVRFSLCSQGQSGPYALYDHDADSHQTTDVSASHPEVVARLEQAAERWPAGKARSRAVRSGSFKLVERPRLEGGYERVLYDLRSDPHERKDVSKEQPEVVSRLGKALDRWARNLSGGRDSTVELDDADREHLRALGYIE